MSDTITTAAREYASRPADERFPTVDAMIAAAEYDRVHSKEAQYNLKDLRIVPTDLAGVHTQAAGSDSLRLASPKGTAKFTHWSFGQLCRSLGAPAAYLRGLPPAIAADAMNFGLQDSDTGTRANILVKANGGEPTIRACTSDTYGRVWDADIYSATAKQVMSHDARWTTPPTWSGEPAGAYRGDRDSFLIITNGGSIVTDPSLSNSTAVPRDGGDSMYRGILIRNSEVGASSVVIETILYRYICGNHMLWGAVVDKQFRRRHVGSHVTRDVIREIANIAYRWTQRSESADTAIIRALIDHELAHTKEAVIDELKAIGMTKQDAEHAYQLCEEKEAVSPRSFWGAAQGITRMSQEASYQDDRYVLDQLAAKVLSKGRRLVAA